MKALRVLLVVISIIVLILLLVALGTTYYRGVYREEDK